MSHDCERAFFPMSPSENRAVKQFSVPEMHQATCFPFRCAPASVQAGSCSVHELLGLSAVVAAAIAQSEHCVLKSHQRLLDGRRLQVLNCSLCNGKHFYYLLVC